jgi:hypothetical protein
VVSEPTRSWREEGGVIYFSVTSDGTTGEEWITRLEGKGFLVGDYAKPVLCSSEFKPTSGVTTEVAVLKGQFIENYDRTTERIWAGAEKYNFSKPNAELACLIREKFPDQEIEAMDLRCIIAMHVPINTSDGKSDLLGVDRDYAGLGLNAYQGHPLVEWRRDVGFAFVASQVQS